MSTNTSMLITALDLELLHRGKVRDVYKINEETLLLVTTDRISAFDVVMNEGIPNKGFVLSQISAYWFEKTRDVIPNAFIGLLNQETAAQFGLGGISDEYFHRSIIMKKAAALPVECVVRGYLSGSAWKDYQTHYSIADIQLEPGLLESSQLHSPIFTPSTKAEPPAHDAPMTYLEVEELVGVDIANAIKVRSLALYGFASQHCAPKGLILADTKFEFGLVDGEPCLIDEVLTPDSSRFWAGNDYFAGRSQKSFDKQPLRDYLDSLDWDKSAPPPPLPADIIQTTSERYMKAHSLVTDLELK